MNHELALLFADFAAMGVVALAFWWTQSIALAAALTAVASGASWWAMEERWEKGRRPETYGSIAR